MGFSRVFKTWRTCGLVLALACLSVSVRSGKQMRFVSVGRPLTIQSPQKSPAKIAFESILIKKPAIQVSRSKVVQLDSESKSSTFKSETVRYFTEPLHISKQEALSEQSRAQAEPEQKGMVSKFTIERESAHIADLKSDDAFFNSLTKDEKQRLLLAKASHPTLLDDADIPTTESLIDEEISQKFPKPALDVRTVNSNRGSIQISTSEPRTDAPKNYDRRNENRKVVKGHLRIPPGADVAMLEGYHIEVYWMNDGVSQATGRVSSDFSYEVEVSELMGNIVAKMFSPDGKEMASGQYRLSPFTSAQQLTTAHLDLKNRNRQDVAAKGVGAKSDIHFLNGLTGEEVKLAGNESFQPGGMREGSVMGVRMASSGYYPTLKYSRAGEKSEVTVMTKKTVESLLDIAREEMLSSSRPENGSVVWGKVFIDGKPASGIRVVIEGLEEEKPLYFNNAFGAFYFPNRSLASTSQNGMFMFAHLPRGIYALQAFQGDQFFGHGLVEVDDGTVSPVEIKSTHSKYQTHVKTFNAFSGEPLRAKVELQSLPTALEVEGYSKVMVPANDDIAFYQAEFLGEGIMPSQGSYKNSDESIHIPAISTTWLHELQQRSKISDLPERGVIVGFTTNVVKEVYLSHEEGRDHRILYFDAQGNLSMESVAGGGFVIFNVSPGSHVVAVEEISGIMNSQLVPVTSGWATTLQLLP